MNNISLKDLIPTIKEVVNSGKEAAFTPEGISMRPMLYGGRDEIVLVKPRFPLKKYDLPLYVRKNGGIVLHRVVKAEANAGKNLYTMRGDNTYVNEKGIEDNQIVAVVCRFKRKGKWYSADSKGYLSYAKFWHFIYPIRKPVHLAFSLAYRVYKKIKLKPSKP